MRLALLAAVSTAAGLGACAPLPPGGAYGYGYAAPAAPSYGYYDGGYATPYYAEPAYPGYVGGSTIILEGGRPYDRGYRPPPPGGFFRDGPHPPRDFGRPPPRDFGRPSPGPGPGPGRGPGPGPAISRPPPSPSPGPGAGPGPGFGRGPTAHSPEFNPANPNAHGGADR